MPCTVNSEKGSFKTDETKIETIFFSMVLSGSALISVSNRSNVYYKDMCVFLSKFVNKVNDTCPVRVCM